MVSQVALESDYCFEDSPKARDVARGVSRLFYQHDMIALCEVSLGNGRRADIMALDPKGEITIVEIKVSRSDLLGDHKWQEYLDYCDRYFWAVPQGFNTKIFERDALKPDIAGLIVADAYEGAVFREPQLRKVAASRRKAEILRFARRAAQRLIICSDPNLVSGL